MEEKKKASGLRKNNKNVNRKANVTKKTGMPLGPIIVIILIIAAIFGVFMLVGKLKDNKMDNGNVETQKPKSERVIKTQKEIKDREKAIKSGKTDYKYITTESFLKHLEDMKLYDFKKDEKKGNNIRIDGENFYIEDYEVVDNKIQKKEDAPKIFMTDKVKYDSQGRMIVEALANGKVKFDGLENKEGRLVSVIDAKDYNLNNKIKVEFSEPVENWKKGGSYVVKYKVENSRGKSAEVEIPVFVK